MPNIRFKDVNIYYGKKNARQDVVENLNVCFFNNEINVLLGDSGSGKTTLLKSLVDMVEYEGEIFIDDTELGKTLINKRGVSYASQNINLFPHMTIFENIAFPLKVRKLPRDEILKRTRDIAERLDISICLNQRGRYLSIGQQQRAILARELVSNPKILLMDEPFSSLDPVIRKDLCKLVKSLQKELGITVIYVTHDYDEAINLADHLFILQEGNIVASGTPRNLIDSNNEYLETMYKSGHISLGDLNEKEKAN